MEEDDELDDLDIEQGHRLHMRVVEYMIECSSVRGSQWLWRSRRIVFRGPGAPRLSSRISRVFLTWLKFLSPGALTSIGWLPRLKRDANGQFRGLAFFDIGAASPSRRRPSVLRHEKIELK